MAISERLRAQLEAMHRDEMRADMFSRIRAALDRHGITEATDAMIWEVVDMILPAPPPDE